jgi:hypothetical protein
MREIEKIIAQHSNEGDYRTMTGPDFQECLKQAYNLGLQDAADNAEVKQVKYSEDYEIDKESILKLKL